MVLLHGPPGTGKTSLCKALAHKLSVRLGGRYPEGGVLVEVSAHSLFSKWFSESGKLVSRLFAKITELVEGGGALVFVLIDEVESLAAARQARAPASSPPRACARAILLALTAPRALSPPVQTARAAAAASSAAQPPDRSRRRSPPPPPT